jgi:hypothetical protein
VGGGGFAANVTEDVMNATVSNTMAARSDDPHALRHGRKFWVFIEE